MSRGLGRAQRIRELERLYLDKAYSDQELAKLLGVRRETVFQDRVLMQDEDEIPFIEVERGKYRIDRARYMPSLRVNLFEALALYLAMRRTLRHTRTAQPHVVKALEKLAVVLKQPLLEELVRTATRAISQPADPAQVKIMQDLALGWAQRQKVQIHYDALTGRKEKIHLISPYLIEPSHWSDAVYVIATSNLLSKPTPFNIARITASFVTSERFELPEDFDEQEMLRFAWGVWARDREPEIVRLRFTGREAIKRMRETIWHPLQKEPVETADGAWIWEAPVAEWREMVPWVRGWGADCIVEQPKELRETLMGEAKAMAELYGWGVKWGESGAMPSRTSARERFLNSIGEKGEQVDE